MAEKLTAVKGMNDIAPPQSAHWEWLEDQLRSLMAGYGYRNLRTRSWSRPPCSCAGWAR